jgi:hypothetical protein
MDVKISYSVYISLPLEFPSNASFSLPPRPELKTFPNEYDFFSKRQTNNNK